MLVTLGMFRLMLVTLGMLKLMLDAMVRWLVRELLWAAALRQ